MKDENKMLSARAKEYLHTLCVKISERCVGSAGNRKASAFFAGQMEKAGFSIEKLRFDCIDWKDEGSSLTVGGEDFEVLTSPYSPGTSVTGELCSVTTASELKAARAEGKILLLSGPIAREQLMPKNFPFYNPDEHKQIISLLEKSGALAIITATGRNPGLAGALYPFPMFEDGDFDIPSVYMKDSEGEKLGRFNRQEVSLVINSTRIPADGENVSASKGGQGKKVVICAHIDSKKGTPGAIDNAAGITVLLLLAELLESYRGTLTVELTALNGEDYYACPGQLAYMEKHGSRFGDNLLAVNIDGAGYNKGLTAFSLYNCDIELERVLREGFARYPGITEGPVWYQGDHSMFVQQGGSAAAITTTELEEISSEIAHTSRDTIDAADPAKLAECALALYSIVCELDRQFT